MEELNSYKSNKNYSPLLPNIKYRNIKPQNEIIPNYLNETNNSRRTKNSEIKITNTEENENEKINNNENYTLRKYNSQINLFNDNYNMNNEEEEFSSFLGNIKISNFYSSAEIIILIERILKELNFEKSYSFNIKDSLITFSFGDVNKALAIFKKLNIVKLNNGYYRNLIININLDFKNDKNKTRIKLKNKIEEELEGEKEKNLFKKIRSSKRKLKEINDINKFRNAKADNLTKSSALDKSFEGIYKSYQAYFRKRKEERRKRELNYVKGSNASMQSCNPYVENDNRNLFQESLRKYKGNNISPSDFMGYIDKASIKLI